MLDIPELTEKCRNEECVSVFRSFKSYASGELVKHEEQDKAGMGYEKVVFHSLRHLSTGYKLKMTNGDVKSVQGDTGHAEAEMVTDVYSEIIDEDRRYNAQKMDEQFYSTLNHDSEMQPQNEEFQPENNGLSDSDMELLQLLKSLTPEMKKMLLKQSASK